MSCQPHRVTLDSQTQVLSKYTFLNSSHICVGSYLFFLHINPGPHIRFIDRQPVVSQHAVPFLFSMALYVSSFGVPLRCSHRAHKTFWYRGTRKRSQIPIWVSAENVSNISVDNVSSISADNVSSISVDNVLSISVDNVLSTNADNVSIISVDKVSSINADSVLSRSVDKVSSRSVDSVSSRSVDNVSSIGAD